MDRTWDSDPDSGGAVSSLNQATNRQENVKRKKTKMAPGDLMKAIIRLGEGDETPQNGDQLILHYTTRTSDGVIIESTRSEHGGRGIPSKLVLGKSKIIKGWEEGIPTMLKGEIAMLKIKPDLHYGDSECPVTVPDDFPKNEVLTFEIELVDFFKVKVVTDDLGVIKKVLKDGQGWETAREPYEVKIWLTGRVTGGNIFFSINEKEPFHFTFGKKEVPIGLELGVGTMTRGEKALIYVTPPYITPAPSLSSMPSEAEELQFDVEVVQIIQVRDMVGDGQLIKRRIQDGRGDFPMDCPIQDSILQIHYKGMLPDGGGKVFYDTRTDHIGGEPFVFGSGEGLVPEGLEMCVKLMLPGEVALITSTSNYAYDKFSRPELVPEGASVQWEVELINFEKAKDWTGLTFKEIMDEAESIKATGNRLFKEGKYDLAKAKYDKVLRDFNHVNPQDDEEGKFFIQARNLLHLNVAACFQKLGEQIKAIEFCNKVLEGNPHHVKALYRRGMSYMATGDFDEARNDFQMMITVDKTSESEANAALSKLKRKEQEAEAKARKQFKGLFDKNPGELSSQEDIYSEGVLFDKNPAELSSQEDMDSKGVYARAQLQEDAPENSPAEFVDGENSRKVESGQISRLWNLGKRLLGNRALRGCTIL